jgi:uncharacterized protein (DUF2147 family)
LRVSVLALALAAGEPGSPIEGRWLTDDGKGVVTIAPCGDAWCGKISEILDKGPNVPATDLRNPDPRQRSRPVLGLTVLSGFRQRGAEWTGGHAYDPKSGSSYRASLRLGAPDRLAVTGCILFLCVTKYWTRR